MSMQESSRSRIGVAGLDEIGAHAVRHLHRAARPPGIANRHAGRELVARKVNRGQRARERRRCPRLEIGERIEGETTERRIDVGAVVLA